MIVSLIHNCIFSGLKNYPLIKKKTIVSYAWLMEMFCQLLKSPDVSDTSSIVMLYILEAFVPEAC